MEELPCDILDWELRRFGGSIGSADCEQEEIEVAREELGTKRVCPETGKKFYDLNKDPIVSPYTGKQYERSAFEVGDSTKSKPEETVAKPEPQVEEEVEETTGNDEDSPEIVSLEDAEESTEKETESDDEELPDIPDVELEVESEDESDDDAFLDDEDEDDDLSNVIGDVDDEEDV